MSAGITASPQRAVWHRAAAVYWWALLALSVVVSSYGNIRHAQSVAPVEHALEAQWIAGALPVVLLLMVEGIAIGARAGLAGWQRRMATVAVGVLACVVLASSYVGLLSLVRATGLFQAEALNLGLAGVPDLLMIAATVYVMSLREPVDPGAVRDREDAEQAAEVSMAAQPIEVADQPPATATTVADRAVAADEPATVTEVADHQVAQPVEVADQPVAEGQPATVELVADQPTATATPEVADRSVADEPGAPEMVVDRPVVADEPATLEDVADSPVADHPPQVNAVAVEKPATVTEAADQPLATVSDVAVADSQGVADQPVAEQPPATVELVADQSPATATGVADRPVADDEPASAPLVADGDVAAPEVADLARRVHQESATTKPLEDVAEVLELAEAGMSQRAIAAEVGVDRTVVSRWIKIAGALAPQPVG